MVNKKIAAATLGKSKSPLKKKTSSENGKNWNKPHFVKTRHFERVYPFKLENNEWLKKFPVGLTKLGRIATYNPDYFCPKTGYYIEVATSKPNISEQGWKWRSVIEDGVKLKVYWWKGNEITDQFTPYVPKSKTPTGK